MMFQYAFARAYAERYDLELHTEPWVGETIFQIKDLPPMPGLSRRNENDIQPGESNIDYHSYSQQQKSLIYRTPQIKRWFRLRPEIEAGLKAVVPPGDTLVGHRRVGDYFGYGYPVVSEHSYRIAAKQFGYDPNYLKFVTEESPITSSEVPSGCEWLPDFYRLMCAPILFRGNSCFSWWAGALGDHVRIFSPVISGLLGGQEHDTPFVEGNHPRFVELEFVTDLHLPGYSEEDRYDYPLTEDSIVIDAGAYMGAFSEAFATRYGCHVIAFEPIAAHHAAASKLLQQYPRVTLHHAALGGISRTGIFSIRNDSSSMFNVADGPTESARIFDIGTVMSWVNSDIDLLKLNAEGAEYEILEMVLHQGLHRRIKNIQVQFHLGAVPDYETRHDAIRRRLLSTHRLTFDEPFTWENYERRQ